MELEEEPVAPKYSLAATPAGTCELSKARRGCPGFGGDRVDFLPSSWYSAGFSLRITLNHDRGVHMLLWPKHIRSQSQS